MSWHTYRPDAAMPCCHEPENSPKHRAGPIDPTSEWGRGEWSQLHSGRRFYPTAPAAEDVVLSDIGHALANICRYNGHTKRFYSVAEHTVAVSRWLEAQGHPVVVLQRGLLHDAAEAYVGDMVRPLKRQIPQYAVIENRCLDVIGVRFGLEALSTLPDMVREADNRILLDERTRFLAAPPQAWQQDGLEPLGVYLHGHEPRDARRLWMARAHELGLDSV